MNYLYGRFLGYCIAFVITAIRVVIKAIQWLKEYRKIQTDCDNNLNVQLEALKYKNEMNKQKGKQNDNQS